MVSPPIDTLVRASLEGNPANATVDAGHDSYGWRVAIVNENLTRNLAFDLGGAPFREAALRRISPGMSP